MPYGARNTACGVFLFLVVRVRVVEDDFLVGGVGGWMIVLFFLRACLFETSVRRRWAPPAALLKRNHFEAWEDGG